MQKLVVSGAVHHKTCAKVAFFIAEKENISKSLISPFTVQKLIKM